MQVYVHLWSFVGNVKGKQVLLLAASLD